MSSSAPVVIQVGLPWNYHTFDEKTQKWVKEGLENGTKKGNDAGYSFHIVDVTPEQGVDNYIEQLKSYPRLDGIVFGFGIRSNAGLTPFFEALIDASRTHKPDAKLLFNTSPDSGVEAAQRLVPLK